MEERKRKTHTSSAVKNRYNQKVYGSVTVRAPKDLVAAFKEKCDAKSFSQAPLYNQAFIDFSDIN